MRALAYRCEGTDDVERASIAPSAADHVELRDALHELLDGFDQRGVGFGQLECDAAGSKFRSLVAIGEHAVMADTLECVFR
jgi:hypothetical protein